MTRDRHLRVVHSPARFAEAIALNSVMDRTAAYIKRRGAVLLTHTTIGPDGEDWNERFYTDDGRIQMLRYRACATFPDGHTVEGDSDEFKAIDTIYLGNPHLKIQACDRLVEKWGPHPSERQT